MTATQYFNEAFANNSADFYLNHTIRYIESDEETRKASKAHWLKCHAENLASDRFDLWTFSAKILASFALAEMILEEQKAG